MSLAGDVKPAIKILGVPADLVCRSPLNCPYCRRIEGVGSLAPEQRGESTQFDRVLWSNDYTVLVPTLGMITPGYFLVVDRLHRLNFALLSDDELGQLEGSLSFLTRQLGAIFDEYLIFEHGPDGVNCGGGGCVNHAHVHLIPHSKQMQAALLNQFRWSKLPRLSDIRKIRGNAYMLLGLAGIYYVTIVENVQSQWIRRQLTATLEGPRHWDWKNDPGVGELELTLHRLSKVDLF